MEGEGAVVQGGAESSPQPHVRARASAAGMELLFGGGPTAELEPSPSAVGKAVLSAREPSAVEKTVLSARVLSSCSRSGENRVQLVWSSHRPSDDGAARRFIDKCARSPELALADLQLRRCDQVSVDETVAPSVALYRSLGPVKLLSAETTRRTARGEDCRLAEPEPEPEPQPELEPEPQPVEHTYASTTTPEPQLELQELEEAPGSVTISMALEYPLEDGLYRLRVAGADSEIWWRVAGCVDWRQRHISEIFQLADTDCDGFLSSVEYRQMLKALDVWGRSDMYSEERWFLTWARICQHLGCSCTRGVSKSSFAKRYDIAPGLLPMDLANVQHAMAITEHLERSSSGTSRDALNWDFDIPRVVGAAAGRLGEGDCTSRIDTASKNAPCWWVTGATGRRRHIVNGIYFPVPSLPNYSGPQPYLRGALAVDTRQATSLQPPRCMALLRHNRRDWALCDLGTEMSNFDPTHWSYAAESDGVFPPTSGWYDTFFDRRRISRTRLSEDSARDSDEDGEGVLSDGGETGLPVVQMLNGSRGWVCRLTVFTVPIHRKIRELEGLLAGAGQHGGQHRTRVKQQLQGMRMAVATGVLPSSTAGGNDTGPPILAARVRIYPVDEIGSRSQGEEPVEVSLSERDDVLSDVGTPTTSALTDGNSSSSFGGMSGVSNATAVHSGTDVHREYWGGWVQLLQGNVELQRCEEGYFDGFCPQPLLQLQDFYNSDSTARVPRTSSDGGQRGGGRAYTTVCGERLRGAMRLGQRGKGGSMGGRNASGGTATVQCRRDEDGSAGYRVTLNQLEVCEISHDSVGYANGLRDNQRVTHVDGYPVSNWEEYRDRAHGRDSFSLTVVLPYAQTHHYDGIDENAFGLEYCPVELEDSGAFVDSAAALPPAMLPAASASHVGTRVHGDAPATTEESEDGHCWCVHDDCIDEVQPFHSQDALTRHMQDAHGVQRLNRSRHEGTAGEALQESSMSDQGFRWSAVRCGVPALGPAIARSVSGRGGRSSITTSGKRHKRNKRRGH